MLINERIKKWNPKEDFILGIHRAGNSRKELNEANYLNQTLKNKGYKVAAEGDLQWLIEGGKTHLFFHHGLLLPYGKIKNDLVQNEKELFELEKKGKLIMLEQALTDFPEISYMVHVKSGIRDNKFSIDDSYAYKKTEELFNKHSMQDKYFLFSTSLETLNKLDKHIKGIPKGSIHDLGLLHIPGYERTTKISDEIQTWFHYLKTSLSDWPIDFVISRGINKKEKANNSGFDYMVHSIKNCKEILALKEKKVLGALVNINPEEISKGLI